MTDEIKKDESVKDESTKDEKTVEVPQSLIEQMQQEIKDLKIQQEKTKVMLGDDVVEEDDEKTRIARMRIYDDKLVIGYDKKKGTWLKYDPIRREDRLMQEIILRDKDGIITNKVVDYLKFFEEAKTVEFPVIKVDKKEVVQKKGLIRVKEVVDYKTVIKKDKVMQKVVSSQDTFTIKTEDGKELELDMDFINM